MDQCYTQTKKYFFLDFIYFSVKICLGFGTLVSACRLPVGLKWEEPMGVSQPIESAELDALVGKVNSFMTKGYSNRTVGVTDGSRPRFELYHAIPSLCSHKCRTVLAEKGVPYMSHAMSIMPAGKAIPQNYRPEYVRLRLRGAPDTKLVDGYNGISSVETMGFDPCVVPTLVDHEAGRIVVDSRAICEYIDEHADHGEKLIPDDLKDMINKQTECVDRAPHVALLYGAHPDDDRRPEELKGNIAGVHARKVRALRAVLNTLGPDSDLRTAYERKILKEQSAAEFVVSADQMRDAHTLAKAHVAELEAQLASHSGEWVCGARYTMADILWTVSLYRLQWLGLRRFWGADSGNTRVADYVERAIERPSFRSAVRDWTGSHGPAPYFPELATGAAKAKFAIHMFRELNLPEMVFGNSQYPISNN
ncbi:MAG: glutathione S-transferase family protein [Pseudomonadota bacterium]